MIRGLAHDAGRLLRTPFCGEFLGVRVLFVPMQRDDPKTNERSATLVRVMLRHHSLIGPRRIPYSSGEAGPGTYAKYAMFPFVAFYHAIRNIKDYDVIFCENAYHCLGVVPVVLLKWRHCVLDSHGESLHYARTVETSRLQRTMAPLVEKLVGRVATRIIAVSEAERELFIKRGFPGEKVAVIPTAADFTVCNRSGIRKEEARKRLGLSPGKRIVLFIGKRAYPPNMESALWISESLAPAVAERFPDVEILMSGAGPVPPHVPDNVRLTGFVSDIYDLIALSDVCISPVWRGVGIMTKVIDTMACGRPTVASRFCVEGIPELVDGENAMIGNDGTEFVEKTLYLLEHGTEAERMGMRARQMIEEHYNWDHWQWQLNEVLEACLPGARAAQRG